MNLFVNCYKNGSSGLLLKFHRPYKFSQLAEIIKNPIILQQSTKNLTDHKRSRRLKISIKLLRKLIAFNYKNTHF